MAGASGGGEGGAAGTLPPTCSVSFECGSGKSCRGTGVDNVCVPQAALCPQSCVRNNGCNLDGTCIAPLALGDVCQTSFNCGERLRCAYDAQNVKRCTTPAGYGEACKYDIDCGAALAGSYEFPEAACDYQKLEGEPCEHVACKPGLDCIAKPDQSGQPAYKCQQPEPPEGGTPGGQERDYCDWEKSDPGCDAGFACAFDDQCHRIPALGESCLFGGLAFGCQVGAFCAKDGICHDITVAVGDRCIEGDPVFYAGCSGDYCDPALQPHCTTNAYCDADGTERCQPTVALDADCTKADVCAGGGFCGQAGKCVAPAAWGDSCAGVGGLYGTCESQGYCAQDSKCHAPAADGASCSNNCDVAYSIGCSSGCGQESYCSSESNKCFPTPKRGGACVAHASGDNHQLCNGAWCCPRGQVCGSDLKCTDAPAAIGSSCAGASGLIACVEGAYCNPDEICQASAGAHEACADTNCRSGTLCRSAQVGGRCQ